MTRKIQKFSSPNCIFEVNYSYLNHVEAEFLGDEKELDEEADKVLSRFFQGRSGVQSRAFLEEDLRYIIVPNGEGVEILEEDGDWSPGEIEPQNGNDYELIYEENGRIRYEEVPASEAEAYLS